VALLGHSNVALRGITHIDASRAQKGRRTFRDALQIRDSLLFLPAAVEPLCEDSSISAPDDGG
jgi:hypothetical protein